MVSIQCFIVMKSESIYIDYPRCASATIISLLHYAAHGPAVWKRLPHSGEFWKHTATRYDPLYFKKVGGKSH